MLFKSFRMLEFSNNVSLMSCLLLLLFIGGWPYPIAAAEPEHGH